MTDLSPLFQNPDAIAAAWVLHAKGTAAGRELDDVEGPIQAIVAALSLSVNSKNPIGTETWQDLRFLVEDLTRSWRDAGVPVRSTSSFFRALGRSLIAESTENTFGPDVILAINELIDDLLLWSLEARLDRLHDLVEQQRDEMEELSTPFIELFRGVAVLPLVGTLDSERAERVTESLLVGIDKHDTRVAVLDITGVPTVDTFVAEHIVRTVEAAKLMGTHCIVSGVGPRIALTMVRMGASVSEVESTTKLSHALERAFKRLGMKLVESE